MFLPFIYLKTLADRKLVPVDGFPVWFLMGDEGKVGRLIPPHVNLTYEKETRIISMTWGEGKNLFQKSLNAILRGPLSRCSVSEIKFIMASKRDRMWFPLEKIVVKAPFGTVSCYSVFTLLKNEDLELAVKTFYCNTKKWDCTILVHYPTEVGKERKVGFILWGKEEVFESVSILLGALVFFWDENRREMTMGSHDYFAGSSRTEVGKCF